jgi:S-methylmethionine-dependent homocysteine/selenocysteine methylase
LNTVNVEVLDGPVGTELLARGVPTPLPLWSAAAIESAPGVLGEIHAAYAQAGATVHTANTFRTQPGLMGPAFESAAQRAVAIARANMQAGARVAGSVAPVEDCYMPERSPGLGARSAHRALARVLADAGCDLLLCETFPVALEAWVAVEACVATGVPTWVGFTAGPNGSLMTPEIMRDAARGALERGAECVLVNCTPAVATLPYVQALATLGARVGAYANAGRVDDAMGWQADDVPAAERYADLAAEWVAAGASVVGSCCGTGPAHTAALARRLSRPE